MERDIYVNPLCTRYASKQMQRIFSDNNKYGIWRRLWIALAESEMELGLEITKEQVDELKKYKDDINFNVAEAREKEVRHDVMAHIYAYSQQAVKAGPIIHLGATSCFVTDNAEIIMMKEALLVIKNKLLTVIDNLKNNAVKYKNLPVLSFTHLQPAQLSTLGKRMCLYIQDLLIDYENLVFLIDNLKLRGVKGTTGTQASFLSLFNGDGKKVDELEKKVVEKMSFKKALAVTSQVYTRKIDYNVLSVLSSIAQSAYKFSNDVRIMQSRKEMEEPFEKSQIGSSAMAYKRNPMRSERMGSLARYVISLPMNAAVTASTQWFERTLDDSANKRIVISQAFLALDGVLDLYINVSDGLVVYNKIIKRNIDAELPFMATETILMKATQAGGDRQKLHERIRVHSMEASKRVKQEGLDNNLIELIKNDSEFSSVKGLLDSVMKAENFIGRSVEQTENFVKREVEPILKKEKFEKSKADIKV